jgi:hypothetical protein
MIARQQSFEDLMADLERHGTAAEAMAAFNASTPLEMQWARAARALGRLPKLKPRRRFVSGIHARVLTNAGTLMYAFARDAPIPNASVFLGVHCFPTEPIELARQQRFVVFRLEGVARILHGEVFLAALERRGEGIVRPMRVYDIRLESAPCAAQA